MLIENYVKPPKGILQQKLAALGKREEIELLEEERLQATSDILGWGFGLLPREYLYK